MFKKERDRHGSYFAFYLGIGWFEKWQKITVIISLALLIGGRMFSRNLPPKHRYRYRRWFLSASLGSVRMDPFAIEVVLRWSSKWIIAHVKLCDVDAPVSPALRCTQCTYIKETKSAKRTYPFPYAGPHP